MADIQNKILAALAGCDKMKVSAIADKAGLLQRQVSNALMRMKLTGEVTKAKGLLWSLSAGAAKAPKTPKTPKTPKPSGKAPRVQSAAASREQVRPCAAVTADHRIVLLCATGAGAVLTAEESLEVANLVFAHFQEAA